MQITEALQNLGLNEKEARVYVALLKLGRASAYGVADEAGLKKPTTYVILGDLMQKGLVLKIPRTKKQLFSAKPPDEFFAEAEERLKVAKSVLPQLTAMLEKPEEKFRVLYYEGFKGISEMYKVMNNRMKEKEILGFYARVVPDEVGQELEEKVFHSMLEDRKRKNITMRGVTPDDPSLQWYRERTEYFGINIKWLDPKDYLVDTSMEIGDKFVQMTSHRYLQGIHIENPDIANSMRQIFEMVWKSRPEPTTGN